MKCNEITIDGLGIIKEDNKLIYVKNLLPLEEAKIHLYSKKRNFYLGKVIERYNNSPFRIPIKCDKCGGCNFPHLLYEKQLELKTNEVKKVFNTNDVKETIKSDEINFYRNKIQAPIKFKNNQYIRGMFEENSQKFIKVNNCYLENLDAQKALDDVLNVLNEEKYNEEIKTIFVRIATFTKEIMIAFISNKKLNISQEIINKIINRNNNIKTILNSIKNKDDNVVLGEEEIILYGNGYIIDKLLNNYFKISLHSFYQINKNQIEKLYSYVIDKANLNKDSIVLDCYSGIGTIGISLAKYVKKVIGVEINPSSVKNALENLELNNLSNVIYLLNEANKIFKSVNEEVDVAILDPARKGCSKEFIDNLIKLNPKQIIYISCNIETQVKDVEILKKNYIIKEIQPFDLFPYTKHIECVCILERK